MSGQLQNFQTALAKHFDGDFPRLHSWKEAFSALEKALTSGTNKEKKILFLDELPWLDTPKSGFLSALEYFWNSFAQGRSDILLIVCGSAASWMIENLINNYGGLHNRVTDRIILEPFTLKECEAYYRSRGIVFNRLQIVEAYMILGGIPYYMSAMEKELGLNQNIDLLLFSSRAKLEGEFDRLYHSLFRYADAHMKIVKAMSANTAGLTRQEILSATGISNGGGFSKALLELEQCGIIAKTYDFSKRRRGNYYRVTDFYSLFYLKYIRKRKGNDDHYWTNYLLSPSHRSWCGYAFERICLSHLPWIKSKLGISGVITTASSWRSREPSPGAQIDLVVDRADNVINLCEIKYYSEKFKLEEDFVRKLKEKQRVFEQETKTRKAIHQTLITTFGVDHNAYANDIQSEIVLDDLFREDVTDVT